MSSLIPIVISGSIPGRPSKRWCHANQIADSMHKLWTSSHLLELTFSDLHDKPSPSPLQHLSQFPFDTDRHARSCTLVAMQHLRSSSHIASYTGSTRKSDRKLCDTYNINKLYKGPLLTASSCSEACFMQASRSWHVNAAFCKAKHLITV